MSEQFQNLEVLRLQNGAVCHRHSTCQNFGVVRLTHRPEKPFEGIGSVQRVQPRNDLVRPLALRSSFLNPAHYAAYGPDGHVCRAEVCSNSTRFLHYAVLLRLNASDAPHILGALEFKLLSLLRPRSYKHPQLLGGSAMPQSTVL